MVWVNYGTTTACVFEQQYLRERLARSAHRLQRARVTNDPAFLPREGSRLGTRANGWRAQERRRRDLIATLVNALGGRDAISDLALIAVKRAAELTCAAERARAVILTSSSIGPNDLEMLSRLEGAALRAVRALGLKPDSGKPARAETPAPLPWSPLRARINATPKMKEEVAK